jgi:hypothetical protein
LIFLTPDYDSALEHQPLDALTPQVIHQRDHRVVGGLGAPYFLPLAVGRLPGTRVHTIPDPLATSIAAAYVTTSTRSSATSAASSPGPDGAAGDPGAGSLLAFFFLAAIAASPSS